jgi:hypothetical protein
VRAGDGFLESPDAVTIALDPPEGDDTGPEPEPEPGEGGGVFVPDEAVRTPDTPKQDPITPSSTREADDVP